MLLDFEGAGGLALVIYQLSQGGMMTTRAIACYLRCTEVKAHLLMNQLQVNALIPLYFDLGTGCWKIGETNNG